MFKRVTSNGDRDAMPQGSSGGRRRESAPSMPSFSAFFAPFALVVPLGLLGAIDTAQGAQGQVANQSDGSDRRLSQLPLSQDAPAWSPVFDGMGPWTNEQVRIERRVILRISPAPSRLRRDFTTDVVTSQPRTRVVARPAGKCLDTSAIGGVADRGDHLLMFMRDRRTIAAQLEKGCSPRDFYRGFYVERSEDGQLCVARDRIMSRSGAKCHVAKFSQLVLEREY